MDTVFMNSEKSKTPDLHRLLLTISNTIDSKRSNKDVALSHLA